MTLNGLNAELAKALIKNYTDNHLAVINSSEQLTALRQPGSTSDARCCWFSINDLKNFIAQVESNTYVKCNDVGGELGIRFYYGEYPAADSTMWGTPPLPQSMAIYAGMHTLMLTPTYNNGSNDVDFDPTCADEFGAPVPLTAVFGSITPAPSTNSNVLMMNHGNVLPPPYPVVAFGPETGAYMIDISNSVAGPITNK